MGEMRPVLTNPPPSSASGTSCSQPHAPKVILASQRLSMMMSRPAGVRETARSTVLVLRRL